MLKEIRLFILQTVLGHPFWDRVIVCEVRIVRGTINSFKFVKTYKALQRYPQARMYGIPEIYKAVLK